MTYGKPQEKIPGEREIIEEMAAEHKQRLEARKVMEEIGKLNIGAGDKIISKTGTVREVTGFNVMEHYFDVLTKRPSNPPKQEQFPFEYLLNGLKEGIIRVEYAEETEKK